MLFVMTPENHHSRLQHRFDKIIPLLKNADIDYMNLYPAAYEELHQNPNRNYGQIRQMDTLGTR